MLPQEIKDSIKGLPVETQLLFEVVVTYYEEKVSVLESRIKQLEDRQSKNSQNSSKPPSTDGFGKPSPQSQRVKTGRKPGGQKGHSGKTLKMVEQADEVIAHRVTRCACCHRDLSQVEANDIVRRQVYDIPPLAIRVFEHQAEIKRCACGHLNTASFPQGVDRYVQYGPRVKGLISYLQDYQLLPCERTRELVKDLFRHQISTGSLYNFRGLGFERLADFEAALKQFLAGSPVVGFDETGFRVMSQRLWLHSSSTDKLAYYAVHQKRGREAMDAIGILPDFKGIAIHDFWKSYFKYGYQHALCNAHLLRDLAFIEQRFDQAWPAEMAALLKKMKKAKERALEKGKEALSAATLKKYRKQFDAIVRAGLELNPFEPPPLKKRGRVAKPPPLNLLERLSNYADEYLRFLYDFKVPFDNNFSERDIRMMKVKQKISGCFRALQGAKYFARIRSYIVSARKQNFNAFDALINLFQENHLPLKLIYGNCAE